MPLNRLRPSVAPGRIGVFVAAIVVGFSLTSLVPPDPVTLPLVGEVSAFLASGVGLVAGGWLYAATRYTGDDCGCGGNCNC